MKRLILAAAMLAIAEDAHANFGAQFCQAYPSAAACSGGAPSCSYCHTSNSAVGCANMNPYGQALLAEVGCNAAQAAAGISSAFAAVQPLDSDRDGDLNIEEIGCGSPPGNASSKCPAPPPRAIDPDELSFAYAYRPGVRDREAGSERSGTKLMRPELLQQVFANSFGFDMKLCGNGALCDPIAMRSATIHLGGQDYDGITRRNTEVTPTVPMIVNARAKSFCAALVADPEGTIGAPLSSYAIFRALWSRPPPPARIAEAESLRAAAPNDQAGWTAVCSYFFLGEGSVLLY